MDQWLSIPELYTYLWYYCGRIRLDLKPTQTGLCYDKTAHVIRYTQIKGVGIAACDKRKNDFTCLKYHCS